MRRHVACAAAAAVLICAAGPAAQTPVSDWAESALTRLAIDTAPDGPVAPAEMIVEGRPLVAVYDRFRLALAAARAAFVAGHPLNAGAPPPELSVSRTLVIAYSGSFLPDGVPAQSIEITGRDGRPVKRLAFLKADEIAAALPGEKVPGNALVASFGVPSLKPGDRIKLQSSATSMSLGRGMTGVVAGPSDIAVNFTVPKEQSTPPAIAPVGVTLPAGGAAVKVEGVLDLSGHVRYARAIDGPDNLRQAALDAVAKWVYVPAKMWKSPIPLVMQATVPFR
jgi:hypothetical protein